MINLREQAELDLADTLENPIDFGLPIVLIDPDGAEYSYYGQILYDTRDTDDIGTPIIQHMPVITLRRSSLSRVPLSSEKNRWAAKIPITPSLTAATETFVVGHPSEEGASIGFIKLYLSKTVQS